MKNSLLNYLKGKFTNEWTGTLNVDISDDFKKNQLIIIEYCIVNSDEEPQEYHIRSIETGKKECVSTTEINVNNN